MIFLKEKPKECWACVEDHWTYNPACRECDKRKEALFVTYNRILAQRKIEESIDRAWEKNWENR